MRKLVIAEKNEAAKDIAGALFSQQPKDIKLPAGNGEWLVCAASGHLLELAEPGKVDGAYKRWNLEQLPISFEPWPKECRNSKHAREKLASIKEAALSADEIYCCGDADDEGQLIVDEILEHIGIDPSDPRCKRVYVNDNLPNNILQAFKNPMPNSECVGAGKAAHARQLADMAFGVNESRLATCKLGAPVALGRVQTPTLGLVVRRDADRRSHTARKYYELYAAVRTRDSDTGSIEFKYLDENLREDGKHCYDRNSLEEIAKRADGSDVSFEVAPKEKKLEPPKPYEITSLQADMSRRYSMTAAQVLEATQKLRDDHKAITYNRTDSPYLKEEHFEQAPQTTRITSENIGVDFKLDLEMKTAVFDDAKTTAHHGIIPQQVSIDVDKLPERERKVYEAIAMRYLAQFMKPCTYIEATASFGIEGLPGTFNYKKNFLLEEGWMSQMPNEWCKTSLERDPSTCPKVGKQEATIGGCRIDEKTTAPPKAFTDGTLASAMANIARYIGDPEVKAILLKKDADSPNDHGSIGTAATRAQIIEGLVEHGYLKRNDDKRKTLESTEKARLLWEMLPSEIKGVDTTAHWWLMQKDVESGRADEYSIMRSVCEEFAKHKESAYEGMTLVPQVGKCPKCGRSVQARGKTYMCEANKRVKQPDGNWVQAGECDFVILPHKGKTLTARQAANILSGKTVSLKGCKMALGADGNVKVRYERSSNKAKSRKYPINRARR